MTKGPPLKGLMMRREFHNMTQGQAGVLIGVSQSHYRKVELGETRLDVHRAKKLAEALDCSIEDLL